MSIELTFLSAHLYIKWPQGWIGWLGWSLFLGFILFLILQWRRYNRPWVVRQWILFFTLGFLVPITGFFLILRLPTTNALPLPWTPEETRGAALVVFSALPWVLAAGWLGAFPAAFLALLSGIVLGLGDTHHLFTPLELALLAVLLGAALQQRYRTWFFRILRRPLFATLLVALLFPFIYLVATIFVAGGSLATRLDYALTHLISSCLATGGAMLIAGLFAEAAAFALPGEWGGRGPLQPSPIERRLPARFLNRLAPLAILLVITLTVGDWIVAGNVARKMLHDRMATTAELAAENVPFFIESGQNLIRQLANDSRLYTNSTISEKQAALEQGMRIVPFFRQLFIIDIGGNEIARYPQTDVNSIASEEEAKGVEIVLSGVPRYYTIPPVPGETVAQVSFWVPLRDDTGTIQGALVGRSDLQSNPMTKPILSSLNSTVGANGEGLLINEKGRILYSSLSTGVMGTYTGRTAEESIFYDETAPDGTRHLVYYLRTVGYSWGVVLTVPARQAQQLALTISAPLLLMMAILFVIAIILVRLTLKAVTASLESLALEANRISSGQLDHPLKVKGEDEVGQLGQSFEQMRGSLKARMDELNRLLLVSQGVASSLELGQAVQPVLESALAMGASAVRVVIDQAVIPEMRGESLPSLQFGLGPNSEQYSTLDEQILSLARQQDRVMLTNLGRVRLLDTPPGMPRPESVLALALRHENLFYGALWLAYDTPHPFTDDETRFTATLAGQAALAASNALLFLSAEIGRQRLAAILASSPDPVLVTDQQNRLLLANPAAWRALSLSGETDVGQPIEKVIAQKELLRLLRTSAEDKQSVETTLLDGRVYLATASSVMAEGRRVGRVCVLRDVTHFKELDALKSEFVSTVSHDLRSPLTLMRGYATMLEMVGNLNEQQNGYVRKIITSVETMSRLVNNLLDLGRIEAGLDLQLEMIPVHDIVERVVGALHLQASQKRIQLNVEMPPHTVPLVEADQSLLQQALHNLVDNAIKYTEPGGQVTLRTQVRQERMVFEISDTGIGIAQVDIPRLFEKFYRGGQKETQKQRGTGLGLAIVRSIAERHRGQVWVESQLGKGSVFYLAIPLRQPKRESSKSKA